MHSENFWEFNIKPLKHCFYIVFIKIRQQYFIFQNRQTAIFSGPWGGVKPPHHLWECVPPPNALKSYAVGLPSPSKSQVIRNLFWPYPPPPTPKNHRQGVPPYPSITFPLKIINFPTKIQNNRINFAKMGASRQYLHKLIKNNTIFVWFKLIYGRLIYQF